MKVFVYKHLENHYGHYLGNGEFGYSSHPQIFPDTMNVESFRKYVREQEGCELKDENFEIKNIEIKIVD